MKSLTLTTKRVIAGVYLAALLFVAANFYLGWQLFGGSWDKKLLSLVEFVGLIWVVRFGPTLIAELREYRARIRQEGPTNDRVLRPALGINMAVTLEPLTSDHLRSAALGEMLAKMPHAELLELERAGGIAQAILKDGVPVGVLIVGYDREVSISVHSAHQRQGVATQALAMLKPIAIARSIRSVRVRVLPEKGGSRLIAKVDCIEIERTTSEICYEWKFVDTKSLERTRGR